MKRWQKIVAGILALLLLIIAIPFVWGAFLPQEVRGETQAIIEAPPMRVFATIADFDKLHEWLPGTGTITKIAPENGHMRYREVKDNEVVIYEFLNHEVPSLLRIHASDAEGSFEGTWTYLVEPEDANTRITIREDAVIHPPLFRFLMKYVLRGDSSRMNLTNALREKFGGRVLERIDWRLPRQY